MNSFIRLHVIQKQTTISKKIYLKAINFRLWNLFFPNVVTDFQLMKWVVDPTPTMIASILHFILQHLSFFDQFFSVLLHLFTSLSCLLQFPH